MTTFGKDYYEKWGRECLDSLSRYWPGPIVAYYEKESPGDFADRVEYRDLLAQEELRTFLDWTSKVPLAQGIQPDGSYHYNWNAHKFGRKVFAITDYAVEGKPFFFIGADVRALKPIPAEFLRGMLNGKAGAFLLRRHIEIKHMESDFAGYNMLHPKMADLMRRYRNSFVSGAFLDLPAWHDCLALDTLLDLMELVPEITNLSDGVPGAGEKGYNVWPNTVLAEYLIHLKGALKKGQEAA